MSAPTDDRPAISDEELRRVARAFEPPPMTAARRQAFQTRLDERLARRRRRGVWPWLALAPATAALAWLLLVRPPLEGPQHAAVDVTAVDDADFEAALLAMAPGSSAGEADEALPEDYEAISTLFLGG